jgi:hypothetical protein
VTWGGQETLSAASDAGFLGSCAALVREDPYPSRLGAGSCRRGHSENWQSIRSRLWHAELAVEVVVDVARERGGLGDIEDAAAANGNDGVAALCRALRRRTVCQSGLWRNPDMEPCIGEGCLDFLQHPAHGQALATDNQRPLSQERGLSGQSPIRGCARAADHFSRRDKGKCVHDFPPPPAPPPNPAEAGWAEGSPRDFTLYGVRPFRIMA